MIILKTHFLKLQGAYLSAFDFLNFQIQNFTPVSSVNADAVQELSMRNETMRVKLPQIN